MSIGKNLGFWRNITSSNHPEKLVEYDLQGSSDIIVQGILAYEKLRDDKAEKMLKAKNFGANQLQFILELSELLNLNELLCADLFTAWLVIEYRDTPDSLKTCLADERSRYNLLGRLVSFYYTDRTYFHLIIKEVISHSCNRFHPFKPVYKQFVNSLEDKGYGRIYNMLIHEYDVLYKKEPLELYNSPLRHIMSAEYQSSWCYKILKEQIIVLETLLVHLHYLGCSKPAFYLHEMLCMFKTRALTGQAYTAVKHLVGEQHKPLIARLEELQVLIILTMMQLNDTRPHENRPYTEPANRPNEDVLYLKKLDDLFVTRLGEFPSHGPLVLGWAVVRCGQIAPEMITKLGDIALGVHVFPYILQMLNNLDSQEISSQLSVITIYHLITRVLQLFDDSALDDGPTLTKVICQLLKHRSISALIIKAGESNAIYQYMLSALQSFPLNFHPAVSMIAALASSDRFAAIHVVKLLVNVPTFTEYLDTNSQTNLQFINDNQVQLLDVKPLFGSVQLPARTVGIISGADGPPTVQWQYSFNAWELLACELAAVCSQPHLVADVKVQERLLTNTRLMAVTFEHSPISGPPSEMIHDSLYRIIQGLASLDSPPTDVLASCLDLTASLALFTPTSVLDNLSVLFLPFMLATATDVKHPWEAQIEKSLLGQVLYGTECTQSRYPVLIASMKLVCSTLRGLQRSQPSQMHQLVRQRLIPVVLFILRDVLTSYNGWRYLDVQERDIIGELCIEIVNSIMDVAARSSSTDNALNEACVRTLLHTNCAHSLLDMISFSSDILDLVVLDQYSLMAISCMDRDGGPSIVYRLVLCLSVLRRLLIIAQGTKENTVLEACISTKSNQSQRHITRVIASYTYHRHHSRLAVLSTQVLNVIAQESQMSLLSSFAEDSYSIRSGFIRRLALRSEDPLFKVVLMELLTTCVENQPGLLELFLFNSSNSDGPPLLTIIQEMIKQDKQFTQLCPGDLLLAGLNFVLALWSSGRQKVTQQLATGGSFWFTVTSALKRNIGDLYSGSISHPSKAKIYCNVLQLLAYQLYQRNPAMKEFQHVLSSVSQDEWLNVSTFLHNELTDRRNARTEFRTSSGFISFSDETLCKSSAIHLLDSFRMFLSTMWLAEGSLLKPDTCVVIMKDVLDTLAHISAGELTPTHQRLAGMLSSLYFELLTKWHSHLKEWSPSFEKLADILHTSTNGGSDMQLFPTTLVGVVASLQLLTTRKMKVKRSRGATTDSTDSVLSCVCHLLPTCCLKLSSLSTHGTQASIPAKDKPDSDINRAHIQQLRVVLLSALFELINKLPESLWISKLHESYVMCSLLSTLSQCINTYTDLPYVELCVALLTSMSTKLSTAKLIAQPLSDRLTGTVSALYAPAAAAASMSASAGDTLTMTSSNSWHKVISQVIDIYSLLLNSLAHSFVANAAAFVAVHSERILMLANTLSVTVNTEDMEELRSYIHLLSCLSKHQHQWTAEMSSARVKQLLVAVCYVSQDCVALLHRPKAIQLMLLKQCKQKVAEKPDSVDISQTRHSLLDILSECCLVMKSFTPDLFLLLNDVTFDTMSYEPLVDYGFSSPALENKTPPSFGSFISTITLCVSTLTKSERSPSRSQLSDDEVEIIRPKLLYILEITLYLTLSQVLFYLRAGYLGPKETNILKREIGTELNVCIMGIQRYYRKLMPASPSRGGATPGVASSSSAPIPSASSAKSPRRCMPSPSIATNLAEHGLYKLAEQFVKTILK